MVKLPSEGQLLVQGADGAAVAPGFKLKAELAHVLEVGRDLLAGSKVEGLGSNATCLVNVALADVSGGKRGHESRPGLDDLRVQRCKG